MIPLVAELGVLPLSLGTISSLALRLPVASGHEFLSAVGLVVVVVVVVLLLLLLLPVLIYVCVGSGVPPLTE